MNSQAPIRSCLLLAIIALTSVVRAQPAPPATAPARGAAGPATAAYVVTVTFADDDQRMPHDEVIAAIAFAASDPELLKRPDIAFPAGTPLGEGFGLDDAAGIVAQGFTDGPVFVGDAADVKDGLSVRVTANRPGRKAEVEAAVRRAAESLAPKKLSKEERTKAVAEIDRRLADGEDKMALLSSLTRSTANLGPEILGDRIKTAELERQRLEMEVVAQRQRSDAIARQVQRAEREVEERLAGDTVLQQLREIVKIREEEVKRTEDMMKSGLAASSEGPAVREKLIAARIRVAEREEALRTSAATARLERLNDELATIMINRAEMEVRLAMLREQQPPIDVSQIDDAKLTRLTGQYRALFRNPGTLPPLYFELGKQQNALRRDKLALLVSGVKVSEASGANPDHPTP